MKRTNNSIVVLICLLFFWLNGLPSTYSQDAGSHQPLVSPWDALPFIRAERPADSPTLYQHLRAKQLPSALSPTGSMQAALRGNVEIIFSVNEPLLHIQMLKQDLNFSGGIDTLSLTVFDPFDQPLHTEMIEDDGRDNSGFFLGPVQQKEFQVLLPSPGLYTLRTTAGRDLRYDILTDAPKAAKGYPTR